MIIFQSIFKINNLSNFWLSKFVEIEKLSFKKFDLNLNCLSKFHIYQELFNFFNQHH